MESRHVSSPQRGTRKPESGRSGDILFGTSRPKVPEGCDGTRKAEEPPTNQNVPRVRRKKVAKWS
ncbi:hypothetical protein KI387_012923, partial [Taxus chinensis]